MEPHEKVVGLVEIADRLGVPRSTVDQWKWRGIFPAARWVVGGRPAWDWPDIEEWARSSGRLQLEKSHRRAYQSSENPLICGLLVRSPTGESAGQGTSRPPVRHAERDS